MLNKNEQFVRLIYPNVELYYGTFLRGKVHSQSCFRLYQTNSLTELGYWNEIGCGYTEKWAWWVASRQLQIDMIRKLES